jgi:hypothetical protein
MAGVKPLGYGNLSQNAFVPGIFGSRSRLDLNLRCHKVARREKVKPMAILEICAYVHTRLTPRRSRNSGRGALLYKAHRAALRVDRLAIAIGFRSVNFNGLVAEWANRKA